MLGYLLQSNFERAVGLLGHGFPTTAIRVAAINDHLLYDSTPLIDPSKGRSVLYLDGEGTASAYVAQRGARIFAQHNFDTVVFAGGRIPANDWKKYLVFPHVKAQCLDTPLPETTEAEYMKQVFISQLYTDLGACPAINKLSKFRDFVISTGTNTGAKIRDSFNAGAFAEAEAIQAVTLSYSQRRVHGTLRKELGDAPVISVEGVYPIGATKENWAQRTLPFAVVMDEADKTGPRFDDKPPAYRPFFADIDVAAETARIHAFNNGMA